MAMMNTRLQVTNEGHGRAREWLLGGIYEGEEWEGNVWRRVRVSVGRDESSIWSSVGLVLMYRSTPDPPIRRVDPGR